MFKNPRELIMPQFDSFSKIATTACRTKNTKNIQQIAYVLGLANTSVGGVDDNAATCGQLLPLLAAHDVSYDPEKTINLIQEMLPKKSTPSVGNEWSYAGYVEGGVFGLIYILERNKNACAVLNDLNTQELNWYNLGLVWRDKALAGGTDEFISKMRRCQARFVVVVLTLWTGVRVLHANILIYDTLNNVAERFDPYHDGIGSADLLANVDAELEKFYRSVYPKFSRLVRPPKKKLFQGIQTIQEGERDKRRYDPPGYCQPFTFLYCQCRLALPDMDAVQVRDLIKASAEKRSQTVGDFIRTYAESLQDNTLKLFNKYIKLEAEQDIQRARQLDLPRPVMLKIAIQVLQELNAVLYARPPDDPTDAALESLLTELEL